MDILEGSNTMLRHINRKKVPAAIEIVVELDRD